MMADPFGSAVEDGHQSLIRPVQTHPVLLSHPARVKVTVAELGTNGPQSNCGGVRVCDERPTSLGELIIRHAQAAEDGDGEDGVAARLHVDAVAGEPVALVSRPASCARHVQEHLVEVDRACTSFRRRFSFPRRRTSPAAGFLRLLASSWMSGRGEQDDLDAGGLGHVHHLVDVLGVLRRAPSLVRLAERDARRR